MLAAVKANSVDKVRRLKERGKGWSEWYQPQLLLAAVEHNCLDILRYLCEEGCAWHRYVCVTAVEREIDQEVPIARRLT